MATLGSCSHRLNATASVRTASYIWPSSLVRITALSPYPSKIKGSYNAVTRLLTSGYFTLPVVILHLTSTFANKASSKYSFFVHAFCFPLGLALIHTLLVTHEITPYFIDIIIFIMPVH